MTSRNNFIFALVTIVSMVPLHKVAAYPTQHEQVEEKKQGRMFRGFLSTVAKRWHTTILVESEPCDAVVETADTLTIEKRLASITQEKPDATIALIAGNYDYTVYRQGNCFILRKMYTHAEDIPAVTLAECRQSLKDMNSVIAKFSPNISMVPSGGHTGEQNLYSGLLNSLTPAQQAQMSKGLVGSNFVDDGDRDKFLATASLSSLQKQKVWQIVLFNSVQRPQQAIESSFAEIDTIFSNGAVFTKKNFGTQFFFGYEVKKVIPGVSSDKTSFWAISSAPYQGASPWVRGRRMPPALALRRQSESPGTARPKLPPPVSTDLISTVSSLKHDASRSTLGSITEELNRREGKPLFAVDDALSDKPVTIYGKENLEAESLFRDLASLYDLKVFNLPGQPLRIARQSLPRVASLNDMNSAVLRLYPAPLRRAFKIEDSDSEHAKQPTKNSSNPQDSPTQNKQSSVQQPDRFHFRQKAGAVSAAMGSYLKNQVRPRVETNPEGVVRVVDSTSEERSALATYLMSIACIDYSARAGSSLPEYVSNFDQTVLAGGIIKQSNNRRVFMLFLQTSPTEEGRVVGFSGSVILD